MLEIYHFFDNKHNKLHFYIKKGKTSAIANIFFVNQFDFYEWIIYNDTREITILVGYLLFPNLKKWKEVVHMERNNGVFNCTCYNFISSKRYASFGLKKRKYPSTRWAFSGQ